MWLPQICNRWDRNSGFKFWSIDIGLTREVVHGLVRKNPRKLGCRSWDRKCTIITINPMISQYKSETIIMQSRLNRFNLLIAVTDVILISQRSNCCRCAFRHCYVPRQCTGKQACSRLKFQVSVANLNQRRNLNYQLTCSGQQYNQFDFAVHRVQSRGQPLHLLPRGKEPSSTAPRSAAAAQANLVENTSHNPVADSPRTMKDWNITVILLAEWLNLLQWITLTLNSRSCTTRIKNQWQWRCDRRLVCPWVPDLR